MVINNLKKKPQQHGNSTEYNAYKKCLNNYNLSTIFFALLHVHVTVMMEVLSVALDITGIK